MISCLHIYFLDSPRICTRYCHRTKIQKNCISRRFDQSTAYLLRCFASLPFGLQITLQCIHTVFQSCTIYTRRDHLCFSCGSRKLNNFLVTPATFNLLVVRAVSICPFYLSLPPFHSRPFLPFHGSLSLSLNFFTAAISATCHKGSAFLTKGVGRCSSIYTRFPRPLSRFCISSYRGKVELRASFPR